MEIKGQEYRAPNFCYPAPYSNWIEESDRFLELVSEMTEEEGDK